jgi:hypothetical protein
MKTFQQIQSEFVQHIRTADLNESELGIEDRRLKVYRELFFNNILGFLSSGFPVLESVYGSEKWQSLARKFFVHHSCKSPYFVDISKEFVEYLSNEHQQCDDDPVFYQELAHYEWLELAISIKKTQQKAQPWDGQSEINKVILSDVANLAGYHFPVHQISATYQPKQPTEMVFIVVYRKSNFEVGFTIVNAVTAHMLEQLRDADALSIATLANKMIDALPQIPHEQVETGVKQSIEQLLNQQILLIPAD